MDARDISGDISAVTGLLSARVPGLDEYLTSAASGDPSFAPGMCYESAFSARWKTVFPAAMGTRRKSKHMQRTVGPSFCAGAGRIGGHL